jgi:O-antigen/teichoic acid export membrane protein
VATLILASDLTGAFDLRVLVLGIASAFCYSAFELAARFEVINLRPERFLVMNLVRACVVFLCAVAAAWLTGAAIWVIVGSTIGIVAGTVAGTAVHQQIGLVGFDRDLASRLLAIGFPLALCMMIDGATLTGVRVITQALGSIESLGQLTAAYLIVQNTLVAIASGIGAAGYQLAIRDFEAGDKLQWRRQMLENGTVLIAVLVPAAVGLMITSSNIARTLLGAAFTLEVAALMPWLAIGTLFGALRGFHLDQAFQLSQRPRQQLAVSALAAISTNALALVLVPIWGAKGASIAFAISMPLSCLHSYFAGARLLKIPIPLEPIVKVTICCAIMALVTGRVAGEGTTGLIFQVLTGVATYFIAAFALNVLDVREKIMRRFKFG